MHNWKAQETRWEPRTHCRVGSSRLLAGRAFVCDEVEVERKAVAGLLDLNAMFRSRSKVSKQKWCLWSYLTGKEGGVSEENQTNALEKQDLGRGSGTLSQGTAQRGGRDTCSQQTDTPWGSTARSTRGAPFPISQPGLTIRRSLGVGSHLCILRAVAGCALRKCAVTPGHHGVPRHLRGWGTVSVELETKSGTEHTLIFNKRNFCDGKVLKRSKLPITEGV